MSYRFHKCRLQCNLTDWYLEIRPDDPETVIKVHKGVTQFYCWRYGLNPHLRPADVNNSDTLALHYNPIKLSALWLLTIEKYLLAGETILVNSCGGVMSFKGALILDTVVSDDISWADRYDDEVIVICRWPYGTHYYLASSKHRFFVPSSYDSFATAHEEALRYAPEDRIKSKC